MKASELAALVNGRLEGGADPEITGAAPLDRAGSPDASLLAHARYLPYVAQSGAGLILVSEALAERMDASRPRLVVQDAHRALAALLERLYPEAPPAPGVHPTAVIGDGAEIGRAVSIGPYVVIGGGTRLGDRVRIGAHAVVGEGCTLGDDVVLHAHVTLYPGVRIGPRSILHSGVRAGVDGFGYVFNEGRHEKVPQVGGCVIGADVEVGANTTIDRGSIGVTEVGDGVKIDNQVHLGHNVRVGDHAILVAQVGVSGSTSIGRYATLAGQVGVVGHLTIGDGATLGGSAIVYKDVPANAVYSGFPAAPHKEVLRAQASFLRLPELLKRMRAVERAIFGREAAEE